MSDRNHRAETLISPTLPLDNYHRQQIKVLEQKLGPTYQAIEPKGTLDMARFELGQESNSERTHTDEQKGPSVMYLMHTLPEVTFEEDGLPQPDFGNLQPLAEGGMGDLFTARQTAIGREVVVKRLKAEKLETQYIETLLNEARISGYLEHPNIVPVHLLGRDRQGRLVLVMKRIDGVSWEDLLHDPNHPFWDRLKPHDLMVWNIEILMTVCNAVAFAHSKGYIHRDIKPSNVMIGPYNEVYLLDWGLALQILPLDHPTNEERLPFAGTPAYMAPEMVWGQRRDITIQTDIYLLGACLYELLTGQPPHASETLSQALFSAAQSELHTFRGDVPSDLATICHKAIQPDPQHRYATVEELQVALDQFVKRQAAIEGSKQLCEAAQERWGKLVRLGEQANPNNATIYQLFYECRFGLEQALQQWPSNELAQIRLQQCLSWMAEYELKQMNYNAAQALIKEIKGNTVHLKSKLHAVKQRLDSRAQASQLLRALEQKKDRVIPQPQGWQLIGLALSVQVISSLLGAFGLLTYSPFSRLLMAFFVTSISLGGLWYQRSSFPQSKLEQLFLFIFVGWFGSLLLLRMMGVQLYLLPHHLVLGELLLTGLVFLLLGTLLHPYLWGTTAICLVSALLLGWMVKVAYFVSDVVVLSSLVLLAFTVYTTNTSHPDEEYVSSLA